MKVSINLTLGLEKFCVTQQKSFTLDLDPPCTVADIVVKLNLPSEEVLLITLNGRQAMLEDEVSSGDNLRFFPLLAGG